MIDHFLLINSWNILFLMCRVPRFPSEVLEQDYDKIHMLSLPSILVSPRSSFDFRVLLGDVLIKVAKGRINTWRIMIMRWQKKTWQCLNVVGAISPICLCGSHF